MERKDVKSRQPNKIQKPGGSAGIEVTIYTDPLCCWTWVMQPQWKRLISDLKANAATRITYKMGGLLPSWKHFTDGVSAIQKPVQMGPEWMHARVMSGAAIDDRIWVTDPPASSFPACIAVKCAELQSAATGAGYFYLLQEAVMAKSLNIAKTDILLALAMELSVRHPEFDKQRFKEDLFGTAGKEAFRKDLQECRYLGIRRMPTILFRSSNKGAVLLSGYQSYESLEKAYAAIV
jgi:putative protein-disulfide isomerase